MKTNKFEDTIRRKLESMEPDFQEADWTKMQNFMLARNPPSFWRQYGSWIGYAAAASVTLVMGLLYAAQLAQNKNLLTDVKNLKEQVAIIKSTPILPAKTDTVYLVQKDLAPVYSDSGPIHTLNPQNKTQEQEFIAADSKAGGEQPTRTPLVPDKNKHEIKSGSVHNDQTEIIGTDFARRESALVPQSGFSINQMESKKFQSGSVGNGQVGKMNVMLAKRMLGKALKNVILADNRNEKEPASGQKVEKISKAENIIPRLNTKVPYRFGGSMQWDQVGTSKAITGEVLVSKKFSVSAGISWLKVRPMEFISEKMFRDKNRRDFKKMHDSEVGHPIPPTLEVLNINVDPALVQIPLTIAFRNELKDDWAYYVGAGANLTVSAKEVISFDCRVPNKEYFSQSFEKKLNTPLLNAVNVSAGIEKAWHPIVVQAEGYLYSYFKPLTPLSQRTGPGLKVKLLYQIGRKM